MEVYISNIKLHRKTEIQLYIIGLKQLNAEKTQRRENMETRFANSYEKKLFTFVLNSFDSYQDEFRLNEPSGFLKIPCPTEEDGRLPIFSCNLFYILLAGLFLGGSLVSTLKALYRHHGRRFWINVVKAKSKSHFHHKVVKAKGRFYKRVVERELVRVGSIANIPMDVR